jgi:uncharacterized protein
MNRKVFANAPILLFAGLFLVVGTGSDLRAASAPQPMPKLVTIATTTPGSTLAIFASGLSKVVSRTEMSPRLQNFSSYVTYIPMLNAGDLETGVTVSTEALYAWKGLEPYRKNRSIRLLMAGPDLLTAYITTKASGIRTVRDLKGKRVALVVTLATMQEWGVAQLKVAGLDHEKDIVLVRSSNPNEAVQALMDNRADAVQAGPAMPKAREADAQLGGVFFLPAATSEQEKRELLKLLPGYRITTVKAGRYPGVPENLPTLARPIYMLAAEALPAQAAYAMVKATWEHHADLIPVHPMFRGWPPQEMVAPDATVPYHEGAIRYFKERGAWTPEMEKMQQELFQQ